MPRKQKQVWDVNLTMKLGTELTTVSHSVDLTGDARTVLQQIADCAVEVEEAVNTAAKTIVASARGFGLKRRGK